MKRLEGKRAVITGAAQGLGQALALRMADEGARVAAGDINIDGAKETAQKTGGHGFAVEVTDYASCEQFIKNASDVLGGIDILVSKRRYSYPAR